MRLGHRRRLAGAVQQNGQFACILSNGKLLPRLQCNGHLAGSGLVAGAGTRVGVTVCHFMLSGGCNRSLAFGLCSQGRKQRGHRQDQCQRKCRPQFRRPLAHPEALSILAMFS